MSDKRKRSTSFGVKNQALFNDAQKLHKRIDSFKKLQSDTSFYNNFNLFSRFSDKAKGLDTVSKLTDMVPSAVTRSMSMKANTLESMSRFPPAAHMFTEGAGFDVGTPAKRTEMVNFSALGMMSYMAKHGGKTLADMAATGNNLETLDTIGKATRGFESGMDRMGEGDIPPDHYSNF